MRGLSRYKNAGVNKMNKMPIKNFLSFMHTSLSVRVGFF